MDEETKPKRRAAQKKMTEADRVALTELLRRPDVRGPDGKVHIATVCKLTGLTYNQVRKFITHDPYIEAQLTDVAPDKIVPTESEMINPPAAPPGVLMSPDDFAKAQAILRQQKKMVQKDWTGLGMDEKMAARMEKLSTMGSAPLLPVIQMLYGGLIKHVATLDEVLEGDAERIKNNQLPEELDPEGAPVEDGKKQREWRYCWYAGYKLHLDLFNSMQKTQAMLARVMREMKAMGMNGKAPEKGVFEVEAASDRRTDRDAT